MVSTRMDNRLDNMERRLEGMQSSLQEAFRLQMETLMKAITDRLEEAVGEIRELGRDGIGENNNREDRYRRGGLRGDEETRRDERVTRVEVPYFTGEDPHRWVYQVERYFEVNCIPEDEKVDTAVVCLEGKALNWYQWWESRMVVAVRWSMFRQALMSRF
ncbi:hypothetical protein TanjilG_18720 [Lupinus angustifolius]|uniref:Retrotransposon gag domain-containing protein n=1 Tax=Lupinus angustifolius TaxID=3871 RepID=A0A1J7GR93_LUPAN|nr:hypothetical protein TanjilG_18720 [Lupinus angustifolius]